MSDDLRTRALALSERLLALFPVLRTETAAILDDLAAELDRVTAERDCWKEAARVMDAEIERLEAEDGRGLARQVRNEIISSVAPYWALAGVSPATTADEVRAEVDPVLKDIIHACSDVLGDGFYP